MSRDDNTITDVEVDRAFQVLTHCSDLILAVSGGSDSLALLYLVVEWRKHMGSGAPGVSVATVDHGLRPESAGEADFVAQHCAVLCVPHTTLRWAGEKPRSGIPNAARNARYALLETHAQTLSGDRAVAVVTAHHLDDQAETLFMRLARGGGVAALAAMPIERAIRDGSHVRLVRPLLEFSKARLMAMLSARGAGWLDDPTNRDTDFERARTRIAIKASGLDATALAATARRMREAREALGYAEARFAETLGLSLNGGVYASFERCAFDAGPIFLRQAILAGLIAKFGGASPRPEASEIDALTSRLAAGQQTSLTLGGTQISAGKRFVRVWREPGRLGVPRLVLTPGQRQIWDGRFWVCCEADPGTAVSVQPLGKTAYETISEHISASLRPPSGAAYGLPAFWADATLVAVPQLFAKLDVAQFRGNLQLTCEPLISDNGCR